MKEAKTDGFKILTNFPVGQSGTVTIPAQRLAGDYTASVMENVNGTARVMQQVSLVNGAPLAISFAPQWSSDNWIQIGPNPLINVPPLYTYTIESICIDEEITTQQNVLVAVCDDPGDKYRYGFNGKEKVNEWAGVGNALDFGARVYDSRVSRFLSTDPESKLNPFQSPYTFANNTPISGVDVEGKGVGYYLLYMQALKTHSTIGASVSGGVHFGVGVSAAAGMAVDYKGNVALFYSTNVGRDFNLKPSSFSDHLVSPGAQATIGESIALHKDVTSISGKGANLSATFGMDGLVATGSVDYNVGDNGKSAFSGFSAGIGAGTPGVGVGMQASSTYAVLLSQSDYRTIADRKWDKEGISRMNKMQEGSDYGTTSKEGFWSYDGTEMDFDPIKGSSTRFEVVMVQKFHYNKAGTGKENRRDVQTTSRINTGIIIEKKDRYASTCVK